MYINFGSGKFVILSVSLRINPKGMSVKVYVGVSVGACPHSKIEKKKKKKEKSIS